MFLPYYKTFIIWLSTHVEGFEGFQKKETSTVVHHRILSHFREQFKVWSKFQKQFNLYLSQTFFVFSFWFLKE